ncbi:MAG: AmmeMemoRadiSam system protein B [Myxococcales bacterium]|nr:AmmeMemoRadiSam system protein B [Myxococcales bacterium]
MTTSVDNWVRDPRFAGQFYPQNSPALSAMLDRLVPASHPRKTVLACMMPHAGYVFSGRIAGSVSSRLRVPERVVVIGPNHTGAGPSRSIWSRGRWRTPLGEVPVDELFCRQLRERCPWLVEDRDAHGGEHSIEVELPFLQHAAAQPFSLCPIILGPLTLPECLELGRALAESVAKSGGETLLIASSDMSHFISAEAAKRLDDLALREIETRDPVGLFGTVRDNRISMCGVIPMTVVLEASNRLGASDAELTGWDHSGSVTADLARVVAYAGAIIS